MDRKGLLFLTEDIIAKIDEHRGDMSRAEFIGLCIETCLEQRGGESASSLAQSRVPVALWIPSITRLSGSSGADLQASAVASATYAMPHSSLPDLDLPEEVEEPVDTTSIVMWVLALLLFGFFDTLTTALVIAKGGLELNPFARLFLGLPGGIWSFAVMKVVVIITLIIVSETSFGKLKWVVPTIVTIAGVILLVNNLNVLLKMR